VGHGEIEVCPVEEPRRYVWCIKDMYIEMVQRDCVLGAQVETLESCSLRQIGGRLRLLVKRTAADFDGEI